MKRVCPTCKTRKFKQSDDGGLVCKYGHKLLGIQIEEQEDDFGANGGRQRKRVKIMRDDMQHVSPAQQRSNFLLVFQYTLQVLARAMIQELDFPPEIEPVVREFWLLYLADSKQELIDAYLFEAHEKEINDKYQKPSLDILQRIQKEEADLDERQSDSSSEESDDDEHSHDGKQTTKAKGPRRMRWPKLKYQHSLVFIYIACVYLNYPVLPNDLIRWSITSQIPYINMQAKIPLEIMGSIDTRVIKKMSAVPSIYFLQRNIHILVERLKENCRVKFPDLNIPLYLDRFCCQFFLPVEGYYYANFIFEIQAKARHLDTSPGQAPRKPNIMTVAMACVIAASKLIYGVDDHESDMSSVSQFDTSTTREAWFDQISSNLSRWKSSMDNHEELKNMIQHLQNSSVATRATAHSRDRHNMLLNILNRTPSRLPPTKASSAQTDAFLDAHDLVIEGSQDGQMLIKQGEFFFTRKFSFAPKNYVKVISLASTMLGEPVDAMESVVKIIDNNVARNNKKLAISTKKFEQNYIK